MASNEKLKPLFDGGYLDVAKFDAEDDTSLRLLYTKEIISPRFSDAPIVCLFNYVFDTLRHDAFRIQDGTLMEGRCTVRFKDEEGNMRKDKGSAEMLISRMETSWEYALCPVDYYTGDDAAFNAVLEKYLRTHAEKQNTLSFLVPVGGMRCLRNLRNISRAGVVALIADKSYRDVTGMQNPHVAVHGSFSFMVNIDAVTEYAEQALQASVLSMPYHSDSFMVTALVAMEAST